MQKEYDNETKDILQRIKGSKLYVPTVGVVVAFIAYGLSILIPGTPGLILLAIGIFVFVYCMVYTVGRSLIQSSKNVKDAYEEARGKKRDAK